MQTIFLQGSEDVRAAGANIRMAAEQMQYVMNQFSQDVYQLSQLVYRLEVLMQTAQVEITLQKSGGDGKENHNPQKEKPDGRL